MNRKIIVLIVTLLICLSNIVIIFNDLEVEATTEEGGVGREGEDAGATGLDYDYMWNITEKLSNIVHQYPPGLIPKGRGFGTWGDRKAAYDIESLMNALNLEDVKKLQIGPLDTTPLKEYSSKINITDFLLHIDREDYPYPNDVPIKESFVFPSCLPETIGGSLTHNFTLNDTDDIRICPTHDNWPASGLLTNYYYNLSCEAVNDYYEVIGNITFINSSDELPAEQDSMVFLIDEEEGCEDVLDNITNASGAILVYDEGRGYKISNVTKYNFSVVRAYSNDNNLSEILDKLKNETVLVDNIYDNETLTFTYNILCCSNWPNYNFVCSGRAIQAGEEETGEPTLGEWCRKTLFLRILNFIFGYKCKGVIYYDTYNETHFMNNNNPAYWRGGWFRSPPSFPALPMFSVNRSVGIWLEERSNDSNCTVSGFVNQEYLRENHQAKTPGVEAYNVIGNLTTVNSPGDSVVIISNRYDCWWDEGPHDSGAGAGIVLAIAKYFNDYNIKPKVNISFLETTGEEFLFRGAQHFSDSHPYSNFTYWIGFDQLGIDVGDLTLQYVDDETRNIFQAIADESNFPERANYNITPSKVGKLAPARSEDAVFYQRDMPGPLGINSPYPCSTICFVKAAENTPINPYRHRTGMDYSEGDALKNINRSDLNLTLELAWNITKYFVVNPDCWFENISYAGFDQENDGDQLPDSIKANYNIRTILPEDLIMINASLINVETAEIVENEKFNFTVSSDGTNANITLKLPDINKKGFYRLYLDLYNSTGRINEIIGIGGNNINISDNSSVFQLFTPFGYTEEGESNQSVNNYITGSNFTMHENGVANNVTAYIRTKGFYNPGPTYKCLIYKQNDSASVFIDETESKYFESDFGDPEYSWVKFNFSSPPELEKDTNYILCCWGHNTVIPKARMGCDSASSRGFYYYEPWGTPPSEVDFTNENRLYSIYCDYTFAIPLSVGWNLITIPIENSWYASDLADSITSCNSVSGWDAVNQTYRTYIVGGPPSFDFQLADGYGYFVDVDSESIFTMDGAIITSVSIILEIGWNLIGWFHTYEASAYSLSDNITDCTSVSKWDAVNQTYKTYIVGGPPTFDYTIYRGMGLFADVTSESTWSGQGGCGSPPGEGDGDGGGDNGSSPGLPYLIYGRAFYGNTSIPAIDAGVTITNENTSEEIFTTVNIDEFWYYKYLDDFSSGWSDGDEITVSISGIDMYSNWEGKAEIIANESVGCQQVEDIILTGESVIIRYDNGTLEDDAHLEDSSDQAIKTINIDSSVLENATSISLWMYGQGYGEKYVSGNTHSITVNGNGSQVIYFNPIDKFGLNYSWQSFDVNISWLNAGLNSFSFVDMITSSLFNNLYIGIDIENDYDYSQWKDSGKMPPPEECEGELMSLIEAE